MTSLIGKFLNKAPVPYVGKALTSAFAGQLDNSARSQMDSYGQVSTLFAIVSRIADAVAQVEWHLYKKSTDSRRVTATGDEPQRTEIVRHAALNLINNPNPFMTRFDLFEIGQQHLDLTGEAWLVVVRYPGIDIPIELWPVRPDRMQPVPHPTEFLRGYLYTGPNGERVPLRVDEVIHLKYPNPLDVYRGMGPVQAAMVDLDSARYAAEWNRNFFINSAEPGGHLETEGNLKDGEFEKLVLRWREMHQGVHNAHRVAVLEGGVKWAERKYTMKDMQFAELRGISRELLREAFGMHAHILGISEDVNKANAFAGEVQFARWLARPRARRWKEALNHRLLPMFGSTAEGREFDHDRIVPEDREADDRERVSKAQSAQLLTGVGYDPAGVLQAVGLPDIPFVGKPDSGAPAANPDQPDSGL
ncbi:phage portal protein [Jiangella alkaliphila]|uniref:Phage portal protein, HK97 family n=1 Tax=Jiangella alkaliphila TaxID=419479 RepID=A0A1H2IEQ9_9ACTN|nr:phage portal protein [Jiangella alkaliphila]SDU42436.1 phage portal protein, HK97 family [Jiangella alkaliphila]